MFDAFDGLIILTYGGVPSTAMVITWALLRFPTVSLAKKSDCM